MAFNRLVSISTFPVSCRVRIRDVQVSASQFLRNLYFQLILET